MASKYFQEKISADVVSNAAKAASNAPVLSITNEIPKTIFPRGIWFPNQYTMGAWVYKRMQMTITAADVKIDARSIALLGISVPVPVRIAAIINGNMTGSIGRKFILTFHG